MYIPTFRQKGRVVLLGDFNARVDRSVEVDDVICSLVMTHVMLVVIDWCPF